MHCKMTHQMIRVFNLDRSIQFYKDALGMHETRRKDVPKGKFTLVYMGDGESDFELELTYNYDPASPYTLGNGYGHLAVYVDDLEKAHKEHQDMGYCVGPLKGLSDDGKKIITFLQIPTDIRLKL